MVTWNTTFESEPADGDDISAGAGEIRDLRVGVRERADEEHSWGPGADDNDGRHLPGSGVAFTRTGATGPTALTAMSQTLPVSADGSGRALTDKDKGRLWVNEGGQLYWYKDTTDTWVLVNNIDPTADTGQFDSDEMTADDDIDSTGAWTAVSRDGGTNDLECTVVVPAQGLWRIEVRYCLSVELAGAQSGRGFTTLRANFTDGVPNTSYLGLGYNALINGTGGGSTSTVTGYTSISGTRSFNSVVLGQTYSVKLEAYSTVANGGNVVYLGPQNSTSVSWLEAVVLPYGAA